MNAGRILIVFGTSYGQTAKIARRIGAVLTDLGFDVTVVDAAQPHAVPSLESFDGIVVGASIIARGHQKSVAQFIHANMGVLNRVPSAFFSVSASAGSKDPAGRVAAERVRDEFLASTWWRPHLRESIAGAINYTRYNALLRWYMKRASRKAGGSTDTSRDHEYTDWAQVERFAADMAGIVEPFAVSGLSVPRLG
jgi:menaquinone-dependent protoporphyrinogen oxidase